MDNRELREIHEHPAKKAAVVVFFPFAHFVYFAVKLSP
jgi:hypothetical protein